MGSFSIYFVNFATFGMGKVMAHTLSSTSTSIFGYRMSLNPGPFNVKSTV